MEHADKQLHRTAAGDEALKGGSLPEDEKRFLIILRNPLPQKTLHDVLGVNADILISSFVRRGWVQWLEIAPENSSAPEGVTETSAAAVQARSILASSGIEQVAPPAPAAAPSPPTPAPEASAPIYRPSLPPAHQPSHQEIESSVLAFLKMMEGR